MLILCCVGGAPAWAQTAPQLAIPSLAPPAWVCAGGNAGGGPNGSGCQSSTYQYTIRGNLNIGGNFASPTYNAGGGGSATFGPYDINSRFRVTTSASASTSVVVSFNTTYNAWQAAPACWVNPEQGTTTNPRAIATTSAVSITWTGSVASAVFDVLCIGTQAPTSG